VGDGFKGWETWFMGLIGFEEEAGVFRNIRPAVKAMARVIKNKPVKR
jgi:hypothetical protein